MCVCLDSLVAVVLTICLDIKNTKKKKKETKQEEQEKKEQAKTGWLDQFLHPCHIFSTGETRYFSTEKCGYHPAQMIVYAILPSVIDTHQCITCVQYCYHVSTKRTLNLVL